MLRPSARTAKAVALAAASTSPSFLSIRGKRRRRIATFVTISLRRRSAGIPRHHTPMALPACVFWRADSVIGFLGFARHEPSQQAVRPEHEDEDQDREDDHIGPPGRD